MKKQIKKRWSRVQEPSELGCWSRSCVTFKLCSQRALTLLAFFQGGPRARDSAERKKEVPPTRENVPTKEYQVREGCRSARHMRARLYVSRCDDAWTRVYQERRTLARPGVLYDESHLEARAFARNAKFTKNSHFLGNAITTFDFCQGVPELAVLCFVLEAGKDFN